MLCNDLLQLVYLFIHFGLIRKLLTICLGLANNMSCLKRKLAFCISKNKGACTVTVTTVDQCLCFHHIDITVPLLPKSEISSLKPSSVAVSLVCVGSGRKPPKQVFSRQRSKMVLHQST